MGDIPENVEIPSFFCLLIDGISRRYPVYQSSVTGDYLYLYDWGKGLGMNWFISTKVRIVVSLLWFFFFVEKQKQIIYEDQVTDNNRGIESPDLEKVDDRCPEKVMSIFDEGEYCFLF